VLEDLAALVKSNITGTSYQQKAARFNREWDQRVAAAYLPDSQGLPSQSEVIGAVNDFSDPEDVLVCASGSLPGDLHKLWRTRNPKGFHLEYGYSCMGYEFPGGLGVKMAAPEREVYVMLGDGGYLMMPSEIITSLQEDFKLTVILINNRGFASIGGLSKSIGGGGFGTNYRYRDKRTGQLDGDLLPVDLATNAESLGAKVFRTIDIPSFRKALEDAKKELKTTVIYIETATERKMAGYGSAWWDVPVAEVSESETVNKARDHYMEQKRKQRHFL
jgi:3D-(3,5/4)-trihydroxycyclohexane-1,2-dione acylhydrolase (decyclizing)